LDITNTSWASNLHPKVHYKGCFLPYAFESISPSPRRYVSQDFGKKNLTKPFNYFFAKSWETYLLGDGEMLSKA
jgi:hypothetical protein